MSRKLKSKTLVRIVIALVAGVALFASSFFFVKRFVSFINFPEWIAWILVGLISIIVLYYFNFKKYKVR